jgi:hypothetical protein
MRLFSSINCISINASNVKTIISTPSVAARRGKAGGGYFENGRKCEIFRKSEKILDECSPEFRGF